MFFLRTWKQWSERSRVFTQGASQLSNHEGIDRTPTVPVCTHVGRKGVGHIVRPKVVAICFLAASGVFAGTATYVVHGQTATATEAPAGFDNKTNGYLLQADFTAARQT